MAIDLLSIQPHKVSRDLSGYITYIYGAPKVGKTTLASQTPKPLLLAFERGYNALPGVMAQDITSWSEMKQVVRELKKPEVKTTFSTICIDTVDIAATLCDKYVCAQHDVDTISQIPYGQGWGMLKREFEEVFRTITQLGYAVFFISHAKDKVFKREDGTEYNQIVPTVATTYNSIVENMADIYGYMHQIRTDNGSKVVITLRSADGSVSSGGRFKYIASEIDSDYAALVQALNDAIDKEAEATGGKYVTDERAVVVQREIKPYTELVEEFQTITKKLMAERGADFATRITAIVEKHLGKGKKVSECTDRQAEVIDLIVNELKAL